MSDVLLGALLAYLINLASNERSSAIGAAREHKFKQAIEQEEALRKAIASTHSIRDELRAACIELARNRAQLGVTPQEEPLWRLLSDDCFQTDLADWLMAGGIEEGNAAKERLLCAMEHALSKAGANPQHIAFLKQGYFDTLDKAVFARPILAHWRHQMSLDYLRKQVAMLQRYAEKAAGVYSAEKQKAVLDQYCEKSLASWDIIDLSNLPEGDIHMATQKLLLRQLYMPLRIEVEPSTDDEDDDGTLATIEERRDARRRREAGLPLAAGADVPDMPKQRFSVGERLAASRRLVVLGDPGGGKTTMLRWMATAYLLRYKQDDAFEDMPDTGTLPSEPWIPVLIRCRDLGEADLCRSFLDFLTQHLNKTELLPDEAEVMRAVILERMAKGEVLLLVDGLDEITNSDVRVKFCEELERTAVRYPDAPIVVTSRIVGYRDMPSRMGSELEHGQIADLSRDDKDLFAQRWVELTEPNQTTEEKTKRVGELCEALHSNERIERLTRNAMLLTTLALVKRKVGRLPNKRNKLYAEVVSVLLNWNPRHPTIEEDEAIPQIECLAYEMCRRGVQQLTEDDVLGLLERVRHEYPNIRAIRRREPHAFLKLLEERSSILIEAGQVWQQNRPQRNRVWEFRHLTLQEHLAARAMLEGRYPGRDKTKSLAEQVAPLAGAVEKVERRSTGAEGEHEVEVRESWREVLRLLVADCKDDDVDDVLLAILNPLSGEEIASTARPRAVLASLCLADEPNVGERSAEQVLAAFATAVTRIDGDRHVRTTVDRAAVEVGASLWAPILKKCLIEEYCCRPAETRRAPGGLWGLVEVAGWRRLGFFKPPTGFSDLISRLRSGDPLEAISAALAVMQAAYDQMWLQDDALAASLVALLMKRGPECHAAAWALLWMSGGWVMDPRDPERWWMVGGRVSWLPFGSELDTIIGVLSTIPDAERDAKSYLVNILPKASSEKSVSALISLLNDPDATTRKAAICGLAKLGYRRAIAPLLAKLNDQDPDVSQAVVHALEQLVGKQALAPVLAKADDLHAESRVAGTANPLASDEPRVTTGLSNFLTSEDAELRKAGVGIYARQRDIWDQVLLSRHLDADNPWLDPSESITEGRVIDTSSRLGLKPEQVRRHYEAMAVDLHLRLSWKD